MRALPLRQRTAVTLFYLEDWTIAEIAAELNCAPNTAKAHLFKGRRTLARLLGMDRSLLEASSDLYATPWGTFRQVTLPMILPAVIAGFLLSFTFSLDDYVVASFVAGPTVTLPIYIFASVRRGVTPEINAIGTVVLSVSLLLLFGSLLLLRRGQRAGGVASKA